MQMNPNIILQGQQPDIMGQMGRANQLAGMQYAQQRQSDLNRLYQDQGPGILAGSPDALGALAQYDPAQAVNIQQSQAQEARLSREEQQQVEAMAARMSAAERQAEAQKIEQAVAMGLGARSPQEWDALMTQFGQPEMSGMFGQREAIAGRYLGVAEMLKRIPTEGFDPSRYKVVGNQLIDLQAEGGPAPIQGATGASQGTTITLSDGTIVRQAPLAGQDELVTGTPRDPEKLATGLASGDVAYLNEERDRARAAEELEVLATRLETLAPRVGYTGPGGDLVGRVDDVVGVLPGDTGMRGAFKSAAVEAQLTFTERTKGAITEREMALFAAAVPGMTQRPEANQFIAQALRAGAKRTQTRAKFMEEYAAKRGSLQGAEDAWDQYMQANPILVESGETLELREEGDWRAFVQRGQPIDYSPQTILGMGQADLEALGGMIGQFSAPQLDALERRYQEIGAGR